MVAAYHSLDLVRVPGLITGTLRLYPWLIVT
jgi:hypothetical protein